MEVTNRSLPRKEAPRMPHSNPGSFRAQVRFLRRQFLQDGELPFTNVLTEDVITQALTALGGWVDRIFSPLVTLWVFLGQVLSADHSCRAPPARPSPGPGAKPVLPRDRRLLPGPQAPARVLLRRRGAPGGTGPGCPGRSALAVEAAARLHLRRVLGLDARHAEEPGRVPAARYAEARPRLPAGAHRRDLLARLWGGSRRGHLPLRRQGPKRVGTAAHLV